jgi:ribonuclease P protein component
MVEQCFREEDQREEKDFPLVTSKKRIMGRLRNNGDFELIYKRGNQIISTDKKLKVMYFIDSEGEEPTIKIGLSVSSRKGNSVWRNRVKRIIKETLRSYEDILEETLNQINTGLSIIFSPHSIDQNNHRKIFRKDIQPAVIDILTKMKKELTTISSSMISSADI